MLFIFLVATSGCTVHIYQAGAVSTGKPYAPEALSAKSFLVVPEQSESSSEPIRNETPKAIPFNNDTATKQVKRAEQILVMRASGSQEDGSVGFGDKVDLVVQANADAYLNCYYQQADGGIVKIFPNRYRARYWVYAGQQIELPDNARFQIVADTAGATEQFMCLASREDIMSQLPAKYAVNMFQKLPVRNFDALYALYRQYSLQNLVGRVVSYDIQ